MRYIVTLWAAPLVLFWGWYFLSLNDISFGYLMLSREVHDFAFEVYGQMLGMDPAEIPALIFNACLFDSLIIGAIWAFRRRREIAAWWRDRRPVEEAPLSGAPEAGRALPGE